MNDFTKEIYKDLGMDINKPFIKQIGDRKLIKFDKLLKSDEYKLISEKLSIKDVKGFLDFHYNYFEKWEDYYGAKAQNHYNNREGKKPINKKI